MQPPLELIDHGSRIVMGELIEAFGAVAPKSSPHLLWAYVQPLDEFRDAVLLCGGDSFSGFGLSIQVGAPNGLLDDPVESLGASG